MTESSISFGTDGWRAVIAKDYAFDNLERVSRATTAGSTTRTAGSQAS